MTDSNKAVKGDNPHILTLSDPGMESTTYEVYDFVEAGEILKDTKYTNAFLKMASGGRFLATRELGTSMWTGSLSALITHWNKAVEIS